MLRSSPKKVGSHLFLQSHNSYYLVTEKDCLIKNGGSSTLSEKQETNVPMFFIEKQEETKKIKFEVDKIVYEGKKIESIASEISEEEDYAMEIE